MFFDFFLKKYKNFLFLYLFLSFYLSFCVHIFISLQNRQAKTAPFGAVCFLYAVTNRDFLLFLHFLL